jgi:hypothetical protein
VPVPKSRVPRRERLASQACAMRFPVASLGDTVRFRDGTVVPALGQGSARLALGRHPKDVEEGALRAGISLGNV